MSALLKGGDKLLALWSDPPVFRAVVKQPKESGGHVIHSYRFRSTVTDFDYVLRKVCRVIWPEDDVEIQKLDDRTQYYQLKGSYSERSDFRKINFR